MRKMMLEERFEKLKKEINGEKVQHEMVRKISDYTRDYKGYLKDAEITDALKVGKDKDGGYLVPDELEKGIVEALKENNVIRKIATVITTEKLLKLVGSGENLTGAWIEEGEQLQFSETDFYQVIIDAHKNGCIVKVTDELLEDSGFDIEKYIIKSVGEAIGDIEEEAFLIGNGEHKPRGVLIDAPVGVEAAELTADNVIDLYYSLDRKYRKNAVFIMSDAAEQQLRKFKNNNGRPIWEPDPTKKTPGKLFGKQVYVVNDMPKVLPGNCPIACGDFSYYWIGDRGNRAIKRLNEIYSENGMVGYRITHRVDGKLIVPEAVKTLKIAS